MSYYIIPIAPTNKLAGKTFQELTVSLCGVSLNFVFTLNFVFILNFICTVCGCRVTVVTPVVGRIKPRPFENYRYWREDTLCITLALRTGDRIIFTKASL